MIYLYFIFLSILTAFFNKEVILKHDSDWHKFQFLQWIVIYLMPFIGIILFKNPFEYLIRALLFGLVYSGLFNVILNKLRGLEFEHYGANDFLKTSVLIVIGIMGIGLIISYELGGLNFIKFWEH